jgi:hypothetical protein
MQGLDDLTVIVRGTFLYESHILDMLQYLRRVRVKSQRFRVRVPWPRVRSVTYCKDVDRTMEKEGLPFQVWRPSKSLPEFGGIDIYTI